MDESRPNVIDFADRKRSMMGASRDHRMLFRVNGDGCLEIQEQNGRGVQVLKRSLSPEATQHVIRELFAQLGRWNTQRYFDQHPEARRAEPTPRDPRNARCHLHPSGLIGRGGCQRRTGHDGEHRMQSGGVLRTWTMPYPHGRYCGTGMSLEAARRQYGPTAKLMEIETHPAIVAMVGKKPILVVDGRCMRCFFRVGLAAVSGAT